jgi:hypothetical protein
MRSASQEIGQLGFAVEVREERGKVGFTGVDRGQRSERRLDRGGALGGNHLARGIEEGQQPGARRLRPDQRQIDAGLAAAPDAAREMLAGIRRPAAARRDTCQSAPSRFRKRASPSR